MKKLILICLGFILSLNSCKKDENDGNANIHVKTIFTSPDNWQFSLMEWSTTLTDSDITQNVIDKGIVQISRGNTTDREVLPITFYDGRSINYSFSKYAIRLKYFGWDDVYNPGAYQTYKVVVIDGN